MKFISSRQRVIPPFIIGFLFPVIYPAVFNKCSTELDKKILKAAYVPGPVFGKKETAYFC